MPANPVLPDGFPSKIKSSFSWTRADFESLPQLYTTRLSPKDIADINAAVQHFHTLNVPRGYLSPETFPLPESLATRLRKVTDAVYSGPGFHVLRGLDPKRYSDVDLVIIYAGVTSYVANQRARFIDHIRDMTKQNVDDTQLRGNHRQTPLGFHTDADTGSILSMFSLTVPVEGGTQLFASAASIYNVLVEHAPDLLSTLAEDWYWERPARPAEDQTGPRTYTRPLIAFEDNKFQIHIAGTLLGRSSRMPLSAAAPQLTTQQLSALRAVQMIAKQVAARHTPRAGDMMFVNNYGLLHAREGWVDSETDPASTRHLMRLWLHDSERGWPSAKKLQRDTGVKFDVPPERQALLTFPEWSQAQRLRGLRIRELGSSVRNGMLNVVPDHGPAYLRARFQNRFGIACQTEP